MTGDTKGIALDGAIWMTAGGRNLGGKGRIDLLAEVERRGSITGAAKAVRLSYKAAWDAIDTMNTLAGEPLVSTSAGGRGGGGARLTPRGRQLVDHFRVIQQEHQRFVEALGRRAGGLVDDYRLIRGFGIRTSARNQFRGRVTAIRDGAVNDEVELETPGGQRLVASITHESREHLGLEVGGEAFALVKSSSVIVMTDDGGAKLSARNQLTGTVGQVRPGAVNTEVTIDLPGGGTVAAIVTNDGAQALGLAPGVRATAVFKASSVIVGVAA